MPLFKHLSFFFALCIIEQLFPAGQRREMRLSLGYIPTGMQVMVVLIDLKMFMKAKYHNYACRNTNQVTSIQSSTI